MCKASVLIFLPFSLMALDMFIIMTDIQGSKALGT